MSSSESDSTFVDEDDDEEGKIYHWIYEMMKEEAEIPSSSELEPVQTTEDERKTNDTGTFGNTDGRHKDVAGDFQVKRKAKVKVKAEKRPWRRAGADISDYFNYGFDEESWNSYCKKQTQLHGGHNNKFKDQKGQSTHEDNPSGHGSSSHAPSHHRQSRRDATGGRREQRRRITDEGDRTRVGNGKSPEEETMNSYNLSSSSSASSGYDFILPQRVHSRSRPRPPRQHLADSSKRLDVPSASLNKHSSGATSSIRKTPACSSGVVDAAEAWESLLLQETREEGRSRERRSDRESCSSAHSSRKEQQRHWEPTKQGHERSSEGREDKKSCRAEQDASSHSSRMKEKDGDTKRSHKHKKCTQSPGTDHAVVQYISINLRK